MLSALQLYVAVGDTLLGAEGHPAAAVLSALQFVLVGNTLLGVRDIQWQLFALLSSV